MEAYSYYIGIVLLTASVLICLFMVLVKMWKDKAPSHIPTPPTDADEYVASLINSYGQPLEILYPGVMNIGRNARPLLIYSDFIIGENKMIKRASISNVSFYNAAPAGMPNNYQVIIQSDSSNSRLLTIDTGNDIAYADKLTCRLREYAGITGIK